GALAFADSGFVSWPTKTFDARTVRIDGVVANLKIDVKDSGPMTLNVSGDADRLKTLTVSADGGTLHISGDDTESVWDWKNWFNFKSHDDGKLSIKLVVPRGADVRIEDLVGDAAIGDTQGPLNFGASVTNATIGRVGPTKIDLAGSGKITYVQVAGDL